MDDSRRHAAHRRAGRALRRKEQTVEMSIEQWLRESSYMQIPLFPDTTHPALLKMEIERDLLLFEHYLRDAEVEHAARLRDEVNRHKHHLEMIRADQLALLEERYLRLRAKITLVFLYSFAGIFTLFALGYLVRNPSSWGAIFNRILEAYPTEF
ncbi:hypothetical protein sscle_01g006360 [Sclerotinia sclerotiorum 1980 UF-70]|uniref:Uncharacterized protein n=1 Tax=Sclerotinia sclerotiorum (strain ATCC 18683 / 1980 / Ss-1) TaxID=665079 RepID=A0A1D9PT78_SCLS1|nr:hypothetical protein sscle_01g006360 [Sclerotinia sclerotiorum 1980 UF-70]